MCVRRTYPHGNGEWNSVMGSFQWGRALGTVSATWSGAKRYTITSITPQFFQGPWTLTSPATEQIRRCAVIGQFVPPTAETVYAILPSSGLSVTGLVSYDATTDPNHLLGGQRLLVQGRLAGHKGRSGRPGQRPRRGRMGRLDRSLPDDGWRTGPGEIPLLPLVLRPSPGGRVRLLAGPDHHSDLGHSDSSTGGSVRPGNHWATLYTPMQRPAPRRRCLAQPHQRSHRSPKGRMSGVPSSSFDSVNAPRHHSALKIRCHRIVQPTRMAGPGSTTGVTAGVHNRRASCRAIDVIDTSWAQPSLSTP